MIIKVAMSVARLRRLAMTNKLLIQARRARDMVEKVEQAISAQEMDSALPRAVEAAEEAQELAFQLRKFVGDAAYANEGEQD